MMLYLHLFNQEYKGLFHPLIFVGDQPLSYYISLFCDSCVPIFAFVSGYGLYYKYQESKINYTAGNIKRVRNLFINYWIILIIFVVGVGTLVSKSGYPGDFKIFILNFTAIQVSYNGAWWFLTTYVFFVFTSSFWFKIFSKLNPYLYLTILLILYTLGFYFRIYKTNMFSDAFFNWLHRQSALYFCTLFQFMLGAFFLHYRLYSKLNHKIRNIKINNYVLLFGVVCIVILHGLLPNFFFAPFFALIFIILYCQMNIRSFYQNGIDFFTAHSTNMWLIHMFYYLIYFREFIYSLKYVMPIYILLVILSVASSYFINYLNKKVQKQI